jgi:hypothetical protein
MRIKIKFRFIILKAIKQFRLYGKKINDTGKLKPACIAFPPKALYLLKTAGLLIYSSFTPSHRFW